MSTLATSPLPAWLSAVAAPVAFSAATAAISAVGNEAYLNYGGGTWKAALPDAAQAFIRTFDNEFTGAPFSFELTWQHTSKPESAPGSAVS